MYAIVESLGVAQVTYETSSSQWSVKTGYLSNGDVFYVRTQFDRGCDAAGYLIVTYPKAKQKAYGSDVTTMSKSFRADLCG